MPANLETLTLSQHLDRLPSQACPFQGHTQLLLLLINSFLTSLRSFQIPVDRDYALEISKSHKHAETYVFQLAEGSATQTTLKMLLYFLESVEVCRSQRSQILVVPNFC